MIESRCGLKCSECEYREATNCQTCLTISKPFWGEKCPIKDCCEGKVYNHCGECNQFPCDLLTMFSYNKEQGDNGKRIEQCKIWATKK